MSTIFISYRRSDSRDVTERIYERLIDSFGRRRVFKDVDSIPAGTDFRQELKKSLSECQVMLVVIGTNWLAPAFAGQLPRLFEEADYVRLEIEEAMSRGIPVLPVLVNGGQLPKQDELPETLNDLPFKQAVAIRHDPDFSPDTQRLARSIERLGIRRARKYFWPSLIAIAALLFVGALTTVAAALPLWLQQRRIAEQ